MALTLSVLLENRRALGADPALIARAGLSLLLQDGETRILFDTGPDASFQHNAQRMGISLANLTAVVLSHGHYDHCGGVPWLADNTRIICHPQVGRERFAVARLAGFSRRIKTLSRANDYSRHQMDYRTEPLHISERFMWSGEIHVDNPRAYGALGGAAEEIDYVIDEGVIIYKSDRGLVIVTGCGHRGIINIVRHCQKITGIKRIHALIGGFHLRSASPRTLLQVRQFLKQEKPELVMGCHCTGDWARLWLPKMVSPATGDVIVLE
ncbi:MBL fold metallo-hydrolase [Yokenella regensburgei]|uniref:MBL fold metallo-hydrolase n=1 Tax=Yokenella regensburgei TaxID=158877 RepID=UPI003ED8F90E